MLLVLAESVFTRSIFEDMILLGFQNQTVLTDISEPLGTRIRQLQNNPDRNNNLVKATKHSFDENCEISQVDTNFAGDRATVVMFNVYT